MKFNAENIKAQRDKKKEKMMKLYNKKTDRVIKISIKAIKKAIRKNSVFNDFITVKLSDIISFSSFKKIQKTILKQDIYKQRIINDILSYFKNLNFNISYYESKGYLNIAFIVEF